MLLFALMILLTTGSLWVSLLVSGLYILSDASWMVYRRWHPVSLGTLELAVEPLPIHPDTPGSLHNHLRLVATIRSSSTVKRSIVLPVYSASVESCTPEAFRTSLPAHRDNVFAFEIGLQQAGFWTFPGVIVRVGSPLGFFSHSQILTRRLQTVHLSVSPGCSSSLQLTHNKRTFNQSTSRQFVRRGTGSEFRELREFNADDTIRRVDWKATARRGQLMVREYEEPREFTLQIILDVSLDMTHGMTIPEGFENAIELIAQLAQLAHAEQFGVSLTTYHDFGVQTYRLGSGQAGYARFTSQLARLPYCALLHTLEQMPPPHLSALIDQAWKRHKHQWPERTLPEAARRYCDAGDQENIAPIRAFLADFVPDLILKQPLLCSHCESRQVADATKCARCGAPRSPVTPTLAPRAGQATIALSNVLKSSRGRELLLFVSSMTGGETCDAVADFLQLAAGGCRKVHVAQPGLIRMRKPRHILSGPLSNFPDQQDAIRNLNRLHRSAQRSSFHHRLTAANVHIHDLADRRDLNQILSSILLSELHTSVQPS